MERINVSEAFRVCQSNCNFKMEFSTEIDMHKAYEAMRTAVMSIVDEDGYYDLWLQDLADGCGNNRFVIEYSTLRSYEFNEYIPAMCKAVAEAIPDVNFEVYAYYDDLQCYWVDEFEASCSDQLNGVEVNLVGLLIEIEAESLCAFGNIIVFKQGVQPVCELLIYVHL